MGKDSPYVFHVETEEKDEDDEDEEEQAMKTMKAQIVIRKLRATHLG